MRAYCVCIPSYFASFHGVVKRCVRPLKSPHPPAPTTSLYDRRQNHAPPNQQTGELIFESRHLKITGEETIVPFIGLAGPGDTASLRVSRH